MDAPGVAEPHAAGHKRLFVGLDLPADVRGALAALDRDAPGVRWVAPALLHLTLAFVGNVAPAGEARLHDALGAVRFGAFDLHLAGVGAFGGPRPRVIWSGLHAVPDGLRHLHAHVHAAISAAGLVADAAAFHPHVTLGRLRDGRRRDVEPFLSRYANAEFGRWTVREFVLFRSRLSPRGPDYVAELRCASTP